MLEYTWDLYLRISSDSLNVTNNYSCIALDFGDGNLKVLGKKALRLSKKFWCCGEGLRKEGS